MYIYIQTERGLHTVGHYNPEGEFVPEGDYTEPEEAAKRVRFLNGGEYQTYQPHRQPLQKEYAQKKFNQALVNAICEYFQSKENTNTDVEDWQVECFPIYYETAEGTYIHERIADGLRQMVNDTDYKVSETELKPDYTRA